MKRAFIVHGWSSRPDKGWMKWLNKELSAKGFKVYAEKMPNPDYPDIKKWVNYLSEIVGKADKETYFIGHSIGCQTIMRYLQTVNVKIGGAVFVAGWFKLDNLEDEEAIRTADPWINKSIDFIKVKENINDLVVILSDNDDYNYLEENSKIFREKLNAEVIIERNKGHLSPNKIGEIHAVLNSVLEMAK